jgi:glycosyltransferase involved in cell wall biosynthesis
MRGIAIVPTFRNLRALPGVLAGLERGGLPILVIDDGSDDGTGPWLDAWMAEGGQRWVEHLPQNRGKGAALEAGLAQARARGFDFAVTVDSDGQHLVEDALRIAAATEGGVLVIGAREESVPGYPSKSMFGRRLWALGIRSLTGLGVADPVCGLRCYPLQETASVPVASGRYAWEEEFLVRAAWAGVEVREVRIQTVYQSADERVSHFALRDWIESMAVWARLAARRLFRLSPRYRPRGPLVGRDRSWRRITGAAVLVGCAIGAAMPWFLAVPLLAWIAWRLHAPIAVAVTSGVLGAFSSELWSPAVPLIASVPAAFGVTRAARSLCSS